MIRTSSGKAATASRLLIGAGALALLVPAIAGCEAGNNAPTLNFHPASSGAQTVFNGIRITNVFVLGAPSGSSVPSGANASLFLSMYNQGNSPDQLVGISAPKAAASVDVAKGPVALPVSSLVNLTGPQPEAVLSNLRAPLTGGQSIPVTLTFAHAGSVTLQVPVEAQSYDFATFSPAPAPVPTTATPAPGTSKKATPSATGTASGSATATP